MSIIFIRQNFLAVIIEGGFILAVYSSCLDRKWLRHVQMQLIIPISWLCNQENFVCSWNFDSPATHIQHKPKTVIAKQILLFMHCWAVTNNPNNQKAFSHRTGWGCHNWWPITLWFELEGLWPLQLAGSGQMLLLFMRMWGSEVEELLLYYFNHHKPCKACWRFEEYWASLSQTMWSGLIDVVNPFSVSTCDQSE